VNYRDLKTLVSPADGKLTLRASDFPDSAIGRMLQSFFSNAALELVGATADADDEAEQISLTGTLSNSLLGIDALAGHLQLTSSFSILANEARALIELGFDNQWSLADALQERAFASLANSLTDTARSRFDVPITSFVLDSAMYSLAIGVDANLPLDLVSASQYLQGLSIVSQFPTSGFPSFSTGLSLVSFEVGTRIDPMVLSHLKVGLGLVGNPTWQPIGDLLTFRDLKADILLLNPLQNPAASVNIAARIAIGGKDIDASIGLPGLDFEVRLAEGETIDIVSLIADLVDAPVPLPQLVCTAFRIGGEPRNSRYEFSASVATNWEILPNLVITGLSADLALVTSPKRSTSGGFSGAISFGSSRFFVSARNQEGETGWLFSGGLEDDTKLNVGDFVETLLDSFGVAGGGAVEQVRELLGGIEIAQLQTSFHSQTKDFTFACLIEFSLDDKPAQLILEIKLTHTTEGYEISFGGTLEVGARQLALSFTSASEGGVATTKMLASYANPAGEEIDIIGGLIDLLSSSTPLQLPADASNLDLTTLILYELRLAYNKTGATTSYGIAGRFGWQPSLNLDGNSISPFKVGAQVDLSKQSAPGSMVVGSVSGNVASTIEGLEFLSLGVSYTMKSPNSANQLELQLKIGKVTFKASYANQANDVHLEFRVAIDGALTLGDVITFLVSLVDPSIDKFEFDAPWNFITDFDLAPLLNRLSLVVDLQKSPRKKTFAIRLNDLGGLVPEPLRPLISPQSLGVRFESTEVGGKFQKSTNIEIIGGFLGKNQTLSWDPINSAPPEIPGQGASVFELRYLGLGQHIAFTQAPQVQSIKQAMDLLRDSINERKSAVSSNRALTLRNPLESFGPGGVIGFSPESEWLIGIDVTLLKTVRLAVIFNDPFIYGLRIELSGSLAKNFAGLQFEILYTRISDTVGKYHIDLVLPDYVRHFTVGAVSVTLPNVVVDIFTNGDFKIDLGFPWNFNFERSFALEVFPFTGAGGFYFNKLSAATASSTPVIPATRGSFTPVYEFGLGLRIGLGKSFRSGPLNAEISITIQGLIEGVISWYNPVSTAQSRELYYKISGGVAIVGRVYGEVDFGIISASVEVIARAMIQFVLETYKPIPIQLTASVSVSASVKIAFVRIRFSFSMTIRQQFTIASPNGTNAPWLRS
jgi:hypothetical protein